MLALGVPVFEEPVLEVLVLEVLVLEVSALEVFEWVVMVGLEAWLQREFVVSLELVEL